MRTSLRPALTDLALGGLVTRQQLIAAGYSPDLGSRKVAAGAWSREAPGLYLMTSEPVTPDQRRLAALIHGRSGSLICGAEAALLHRARDVPRRAVVDVLVQHEHQIASGPAIRVHRARHLPSSIELNGWPVVQLPLAVVQAARWADHLRDARAVLLAAVCDGRCTVEELAAALAVGGNKGRKQAARAVRDAGRGAWSAPEAEAADLLVPEVLAGRLPPFWLNPEVWVGDRKLGVVDLLVKGRAFAGEVDSVQHHSGDHLSATFDRHKRFGDHGVELLHRTPGRIRSAPVQWVRDMVAGAASAAPLPAGLRIVPRGPLLPEGFAPASRRNSGPG